MKRVKKKVFIRVTLVSMLLIGQLATLTVPLQARAITTEASEGEQGNSEISTFSSKQSVELLEATIENKIKKSGIDSANGSRSEYIAATPEQIASRNAEENARFNFDPLVKVVEVSTFLEFQSAYKDNSVTKIIMLNDIAHPSNIGTEAGRMSRKKSIEIDGRGHSLFLNLVSLHVTVGADAQNFFHLHDMHMKQRGAEDYAYSRSFVAGEADWLSIDTQTRNWNFRFGNIETDELIGQTPNRTAYLPRMVRASRAELTLYGTLNLYTTSENTYAGSIVMDDGTNYRGSVHFDNFSVNYYVEPGEGKDTGSEQKFYTGKNSKVSMANVTNGATYPAVFNYYSDLVVEKGAIFNSNMAGNAV